MVIDARIETETGSEIEVLYDPDDMVLKLLPNFDDEQSVCLRFIDPYGNTVFNQGQLPVLITELKAVLSELEENEVTKHGKALLKLASRASGKVHTYLKFYGD